MNAKRVVLSGGSGFIGRSVTAFLLASGYEVVVLSRQPRNLPEGVIGAAWDGRTQGDWARWLDGAHAVINLAGKNVNCPADLDDPWELARMQRLPNLAGLKSEVVVPAYSH